MVIRIDKGHKASFKIKVTDKMVHQFAEMCGDFNPIHLNDEYAKTTRFGRRIAHGMIMAALFSKCMNESLGEGGIYLSQTMKFVNPVYIDDEVIIDVHVTGMSKARGIATAETIARKETGEIYVKGEAMIMVADGVQKEETV